MIDDTPIMFLLPDLTDTERKQYDAIEFANEAVEGFLEVYGEGILNHEGLPDIQAKHVNDGLQMLEWEDPTYYDEEYRQMFREALKQGLEQKKQQRHG